MNEQLLVVVGISGVALLLMLSLLLVLRRSLRDVPSGHALVIRSLSGEPKVCFERSVVIPLLQSAELLDISAKPIVIERGPAHGLRCADGIRASLRAVFVVRVNPTADDVNSVRSRVSAASLASPEFMRELFADRFTHALETVVAQLNFDELPRHQDELKERVLHLCGDDLGGFVLDDLSVTNIEMVPLSELDPKNPSDAQGIRKITEITQTEQLRTAEINKEVRAALAKLELDEREILLALERQQAELSRKHASQTGSAPDIDELRAGLDARIRELVRLVQSQS